MVTGPTGSLLPRLTHQWLIGCYCLPDYLENTRPSQLSSYGRSRGASTFVCRPEALTGPPHSCRGWEALGRVQAPAGALGSVQPGKIPER